MKKALPAIVLFVLFLSCGHPAAGQNSLPAASQNSLDRQLLYETDLGPLDKIDSLLRQGANIDVRGGSGNTPLIVAAERGNADIVRLLLERGAKIEVKGFRGKTALMEAKTAEVAQLLLDNGADINVSDADGYTALIDAASEGHSEVIRALLDRGANMEAKINDVGWTALMKAVQMPYADAVKLLLDHGADIEATDSTGETALIVAAGSLAESTDGMRVLLERSANIEAKDKWGKTPLIIAAEGGHKIGPDYMRMLLARGANIEAKNPYGQTALFFAVFEADTIGDPNAVQLLLEHGANIMVRDTLKGDTALTYAACDYSYKEAAKLATVKQLVNKGADIEARNREGKTALACALEKKQQSVADYLESVATQQKMIEQGASMDVKDRFALYIGAFAKSPHDEALRQRIIALTSQLTEAPAIPEEARQLFTTATNQIKQAGTPAALDQPIALLRKALEIAPWWSNAYYNLSRVLEMRGRYDDATRQLNYYLELKPAEADAIEARAHLVVIQTEKDAAAVKQ